MIVYTRQSNEVLDILLEKGIFKASLDKSEAKDDDIFFRSYKWINNQLYKRLKLECETPIWFWDKHPENYFDVDYFKYCENDVIIKLDIPENLILWSDFDLFHAVLNNISLSDFTYNSEITEELKEKSWEYIFDFEMCKKLNESEILCLQGITSEIKKEWVVEVEIMGDKLHDIYR
jgi:hypothetical protein